MVITIFLCTPLRIRYLQAKILCSCKGEGFFEGGVFPITTPGQWKVGDKPGNAYFHSRDLACLKRISELSNVNETHIYIEDGIYHSLSEEHLELLDRCGHLVPLRKTRAKLIQKK